MTVLRLIRNDVIPAHQICKGAPWVIKASALEGVQLNSAGAGGRKRPLTPDRNQKTLVS